MEKSITGLNELKPILASLKEKQLLVELTPAGRGQAVTHNLYLPEELNKLNSQFGTTGSGEPSANETAVSQSSSRTPESSGQRPQSRVERRGAGDSRIEQLEQQLRQLKQTVETLRQEVGDLKQLI